MSAVVPPEPPALGLRLPLPPARAPALRAPREVLYAAAVFHACMAGSFYGFWQLQGVLVQEGGYREECAPGTPLAAGCRAQDVAWGNLFTYTSVLAFGVPLLSGLVVPAAGPRRTVLALTAVFAAGFGLLLAAAAGAPGPGQLQSALILPALACIATAAASNYLPLLSVALLFQRSSLFLSVLSGSFDAGSGVFLVMRLMYGAGVPLRTLLAAFLGAPVLCMLACAALLWRDAPFQPPLEAPSSPRVVMAALAAHGSVHGGSAFSSPQGGEGAAAAAAAPGQEQPKPPPPPPAFLPGLDTQRLQALPLLQQLTSAEYLGFLAYFCALALRFNYYLSSVATQLGAAGSAADVTLYINALGYLMPTLAIPAVLCAGYVLDAAGPLAGLTLLSCLATLLSALQMVPSLQLQGFTALVFVLFRGTLFSCLSVFLSLLFGFRTLSPLVGSVTCLSGVFSLLTSPLMQWGVAAGFAGPNALILALSALSLAFPMWMAVRGGHSSLWAALRK